MNSSHLSPVHFRISKIPMMAVLVLAAAFGAFAQDKPFDPFAAGAADDVPKFQAAPAAPKSEVRFLADMKAIAPGQAFTVMIELAHPEHWHSYYVNPGTVGLTLEPNWELPPGFEATRVAWPTPHISQTAGLNTYGYEGTVRHLFTLTPPADLAAGSTVKIVAKPSWQICDEKNCVGEPPYGTEAAYELDLDVAENAQPDPAVAEVFKSARASLPTSLPEEISVTAVKIASEVIVGIAPTSAVPAGDIYFFDDAARTDAQSVPKVDRGEKAVSWTIGRSQEKKAPPIDRLSGILAIGERGYLLDVEVERAPAEPVAFGALLKILGGMFLGGMILNLMPCVFPVIGLKIMGFVQQAGEDRKKIAMHGIIFAVGVVLSFWVLSGLLLGLREGVLGSGAGSADVSWGYQMQNPWVVWGLMLIMFLLALNMYGVFEIGTSATGVGGSLAQKQGAAGTFFSGILATVVATPCSAPLLGAAIGATIGLPPLTFMLSFTAMAIGLAFPYLLLSLFPQLVEKLPRPGPWMESFKQAMSFLLFATAGYLLWVYIDLIEIPAMLKVVIGLTAIAISLWIYGRWCGIAASKKARTIGFVFLILFAILGVKASMPPGEERLDWEKWSPELVEEALEEGRPVFVDFTASWCLTCQVNKGRAYSDEVALAMEKYNVLSLKADKSKASPEIDAAIRELGRAAVPVNALYMPGKDEPQLTTEAFGASYLLKFLDEHLQETEAQSVE